MLHGSFQGDAMHVCMILKMCGATALCHEKVVGCEDFTGFAWCILGFPKRDNDGEAAHLFV